MSRSGVKCLVELCVPALLVVVLSSCAYDLYEYEEDDYGAVFAQFMGQYKEQAEGLSAQEKASYAARDLPAIPVDYDPWWLDQVGRQVFSDAVPEPASLEDLYNRALVHSTQIAVFNDIPLIRETGIREARAAFDPVAFAEGKYEHSNEPVGSTLTTQLDDEFDERESALEVGVKQKLPTGAEAALSQRIGRVRNNSNYFIPNPQTQAQLVLSVVQPLLRGAWTTYNKSIIRIAQIDSEMAKEEFLRQAQSHLMEISRAYWSMFLARAMLLQQERLVAEARDVIGRLEQRRDIEAVAGQVERARSALMERQAAMVRSEMAIKNAEDRVKALVNDPEMTLAHAVELVPADPLYMLEAPVDVRESAVVALNQRPEVKQGFSQLRATALRLDMAKNEVLPVLNLILETSLSGLGDHWNLDKAVNTEFDHFGYLMGLRFEYPLGNRAADARMLRKRLEMRQQIAQVKTTLETVLLEVKFAVRDVKTSYREMQSRYQTVLAAQEDLRVLQERWEVETGGGRPGSAYLELLLTSQERLASAEEGLLRSSVAYNVALVNLERAQGTLLQYEEIEAQRVEPEEGVPYQELRRAPRPVFGVPEDTRMLVL
jgi:outer membrane protein